MDCYDRTLSCAVRRMPEQGGNTGDGRHKVFGGEDSTSPAKAPAKHTGIYGKQLRQNKRLETQTVELLTFRWHLLRRWHFARHTSQSSSAHITSSLTLGRTPSEIFELQPRRPFTYMIWYFFSTKWPNDRCYLSCWCVYLSLSTTGSSVNSSRNCKALRPPPSFVSWLFLPPSRSISPLPAPCTSIRECSSRAQQAQRLSS